MYSQKPGRCPCTNDVTAFGQVRQLGRSVLLGLTEVQGQFIAIREPNEQERLAHQLLEVGAKFKMA
jgi:hypothetical protein